MTIRYAFVTGEFVRETIRLIRREFRDFAINPGDLAGDTYHGWAALFSDGEELDGSRVNCDVRLTACGQGWLLSPLVEVRIDCKAKADSHGLGIGLREAFIMLRMYDSPVYCETWTIVPQSDMEALR